MGLTKAHITNKETNETITCLFNPTEYTVDKQNSWQSKPVVGKNVPKLDFTGGGAHGQHVRIAWDLTRRHGVVAEEPLVLARGALVELSRSGEV